MQRRSGPNPNVIRCACTASDLVGHAVYFAGPPVAGAPFVRKANCLEPTRMPAIGVIVSKASDEVCYVQRRGFVRAYSGLEIGMTYLVGPSGVPVRHVTVPAPLGLSMVQFLGVAATTEALDLEISADMKIKRG